MEDGGDGYDEAESLMANQWPSSREEDMRHLSTEVDIDDEETPFPGVTGTLDADEAISEADPYVPPIDPPVLPGGPEGIHVATGFGLSSEDEAADDPGPRGDADIREEATLTLQHDSLTSQYDLRVSVLNGVIRLRGAVDSMEAADHASWILGELKGVVDVVDDTTLTPIPG
jgi:BON domain